MAIIVENEYSAVVSKKSTSHSIASIVVPTSTNRAIYVLVGTSQKLPNASKYVTGVNWNTSESFTKIGEAQNGKVTVAVWRLLAPTEGTFSIDVTYVDNNATWNGSSIGVQVLSNVNQTTPEDSWEAPSTGASTTPAHTVTSSSGDYVVDIVSSLSATGTLTESGAGTLIWTDNTNTAGFGSADLQTTGNAAMAWTISVTTDWIHGGVSVNPSSSESIAALTTVASTSTTGSTTGNISVSLTGVISTVAAGTLASIKSLVLAGVLAISAIGSIGFTEAGSIALTGVQATSAVGSVSSGSDVEAPVTGVAVTSAVGTISFTEEGSVNLTGVTGASTVGSVTASADATQVLTGIEVTSAVGNIAFTESGVVELSGVVTTSIVGTVSFTEAGSVELSSVLGTGAAGTVTTSSDAGAVLTGVSSTSNVGTVSFVESGTVSITGNESIGTVGSLSTKSTSTKLYINLVSGELIFLLKEL